MDARPDPGTSFSGNRIRVCVAFDGGAADAAVELSALLRCPAAERRCDCLVRTNHRWSHAAGLVLADQRQEAPGRPGSRNGELMAGNGSAGKGSPQRWLRRATLRPPGTRSERPPQVDYGAERAR